MLFTGEEFCAFEVFWVIAYAVARHYLFSSALFYKNWFRQHGSMGSYALPFWGLIFGLAGFLPWEISVC